MTRLAVCEVGVPHVKHEHDPRLIAAVPCLRGGRVGDGGPASHRGPKTMTRRRRAATHTRAHLGVYLGGSTSCSKESSNANGRSSEPTTCSSATRSSDPAAPTRGRWTRSFLLVGPWCLMMCEPGVSAEKKAAACREGCGEGSRASGWRRTVFVRSREVGEERGGERAPRAVLGEGHLRAGNRVGATRRAAVACAHLVQAEVKDVPVARIVRDRAGAVRRCDLILRRPLRDLERLEAAT